MCLSTSKYCNKMRKICIWLIALIITASLGMGLLSSCGKKNNNKTSVKEMAEKVWQFSQLHPDGFTVDVRTMEEPTEGIAVSYAATQGCHSRESLTAVVQHALEHDGYVGGWFDTGSGLYYFDSTKIFPGDQMDEALEFARENGQIAIYIISTGEEVRVDKEIKMAA